uniref:Leucine-rich repeat, plant specific n=1 Tax=Medicago truncatula TaxID=3880 RepID=A2Q5U4_MEDTR|nr:Leucine-rich repeat, plant specific [Medicago truncatula]
MIGNSLQQIDLSNNNLQGQLPRALVNNRRLEFFDVSYNNINDSFPFWMGELPELKVLSLSNNEFHGDIRCSGNMTCTFSILHILDLSHNDFSGSFPTEMIQSWKAMNTSNAKEKFYSFTMSNKGLARVYEKLQKFYSLIAIDISSNKISGEIPQMIGELKGLVLLNLSNNMLIGSIPSSLGKLSNLEALDLSLNSLSGKIPQQLAQITFLEYLNVSFNNLTGPIPQNNQFSTFKGGDQLLKKCIDPAGPSTSDDDDDDSKSFIELYWTVVLIGYGGGLVAGVALGNTYFLQ